MLSKSLEQVVSEIGNDIKNIKKETNEKFELLDNIKADKTIVANLNDELEKKMPINGGTFTKNPNVNSGDFSGIIFTNPTNKKFIVEGAPDDRNRMGALLLLSDTNTDINRLTIPLENGTLATKENINSLKTQLESKINGIPKTIIDGKSGTTTLHAILHKYNDNTSFNGLSNQQWSQQGVFSCYFTQLNRLENQPTQYGQLINLPPSHIVGNAEVAQLWISQNDGQLFSRGGNSANAVRNRPFNRFVRDVDISSWRKVINTWRSGNNWWREWSDGWIEQGGIAEIARDGGSGYKVAITINLFKPVSTQPTITFSISASHQSLYESGTNTPFITIQQHSGTMFKLSTNVMNEGKEPTWLIWEAKGWK